MAIYKLRQKKTCRRHFSQDFVSSDQEGSNTKKEAVEARGQTADCTWDIFSHLQRIQNWNLDVRPHDRSRLFTAQSGSHLSVNSQAWLEDRSRSTPYRLVIADLLWRGCQFKLKVESFTRAYQPVTISARGYRIRKDHQRDLTHTVTICKMDASRESVPSGARARLSSAVLLVRYFVF